ncbi:hypothetical protein KFE25_004647 [Diacronema lutheri]|uniref:Uncharacterized protein n=1 Tax=Diacronema lutheri TaxID=2081491 RepID=A0A8J5X788_DIALT|nr:hypothetical protein KFE25_004647 [Diacronema lutheri]
MVAPPPVDLTAASRRLRALASTLRDEASAIAAGQAALEAVRDARADLAQAEGALDLLGSAELRALGKVTEELHQRAIDAYNNAQAEAEELSAEAGADIAILAEAQGQAFASSHRQLSAALAALDAAADADAGEAAPRGTGVMLGAVRGAAVTYAGYANGYAGLTGATAEQRADLAAALDDASALVRSAESREAEAASALDALERARGALLASVRLRPAAALTPALAATERQRWTRKATAARRQLTRHEAEAAATVDATARWDAARGQGHALLLALGARADASIGLTHLADAAPAAAEARQASAAALRALLTADADRQLQVSRAALAANCVDKAKYARAKEELARAAGALNALGAVQRDLALAGVPEALLAADEIDVGDGPASANGGPATAVSSGGGPASAVLSGGGGTSVASGLASNARRVDGGGGGGGDGGGGGGDGDGGGGLSGGVDGDGAAGSAAPGAPSAGAPPPPSAAMTEPPPSPPGPSPLAADATADGAGGGGDAPHTPQRPPTPPPPRTPPPPSSPTPVAPACAAAPTGAAGDVPSAVPAAEQAAAERAAAAAGAGELEYFTAEEELAAMLIAGEWARAHLAARVRESEAVASDADGALGAVRAQINAGADAARTSAAAAGDAPDGGGGGLLGGASGGGAYLHKSAVVAAIAADACVAFASEHGPALVGLCAPFAGVAAVDAAMAAAEAAEAEAEAAAAGAVVDAAADAADGGARGGAGDFAPAAKPSDRGGAAGIFDAHGEAKAAAFAAAGSLDLMDRLAHAATTGAAPAGTGASAGAHDAGADALTSRVRQRWEQQRGQIALAVAACRGATADEATAGAAGATTAAVRSVGAAVLSAVRFESLALPLEQLHQSLKIASLAPSIARRKQAAAAAASAQGELCAIEAVEHHRDGAFLGGLGVDAAAAAIAAAAAVDVRALPGGDGTATAAAARVRAATAINAVRASVRAGGGLGRAVGGLRREARARSRDDTARASRSSSSEDEAESEARPVGAQPDRVAGPRVTAAHIVVPDARAPDEAETLGQSLTIYDLLPRALSADKAAAILAERAALPDEFRAFMEAAVSPVVQEALLAACCVRPRQPVLFISEFLHAAATGRSRWAKAKAELRAARAANATLALQLAAVGVRVPTGAAGAVGGEDGVDGEDGKDGGDGALAGTTPAESARSHAMSGAVDGGSMALVALASPALSLPAPRPALPQPPPSAAIAYELFLNEAAGLVVCLCRLLPGCSLEPIVTSDSERGVTTLVLRVEPPYHDATSHPKTLLRGMPRALATAAGGGDGRSAGMADNDIKSLSSARHGGARAGAGAGGGGGWGGGGGVGGGDTDSEAGTAAEAKWADFARRSELGAWKTVRSSVGARVAHGSLRMLAEVHEVRIPHAVKESECECETIDSRKTQTRTTAIVMPLDQKLTAGRSLGRRRA